MHLNVKGYNKHVDVAKRFFKNTFKKIEISQCPSENVHQFYIRMKVILFPCLNS